MTPAALISALLEPQVVVAFITFVVAPIVTVLLAARKPKSDGATKEPPAPKRASDSVLMEAFAQWSNMQTEEIADLKEKVEKLIVEVTNLKRVNVYLRQHNVVLSQQLIRAGETPFPAASPEE